MPIREALRRLEMEGLVEILPHKGAVVTAITLDDIEEIYELRALLEGVAVEKSMPAITVREIKQLAELTRQMDVSAREQAIDEFIEYNQQFHSLLRIGCQGKRIERLIEQMWNGYPPYAPSLLPETMLQSNKEHIAMLEAVSNKDAARARGLMEKHITRTGKALKAKLLGK
jgi:DNA-binding GntR family transcriptional regulator